MRDGEGLVDAIGEGASMRRHKPGSLALHSALALIFHLYRLIWQEQEAQSKGVYELR